MQINVKCMICIAPGLEDGLAEAVDMLEFWDFAGKQYTVHGGDS